MEQLADSPAALLADMEQLVGTASADGSAAFPEECSAPASVVSEPVGLQFVSQFWEDHLRVEVIPQSVEPPGEIGSNWGSLVG